MSVASKAVNDQQRAMMWALVAVRRLARKASQSASTPDLPTLKRLLNYVERVAEKQHQANEERYMLRPLETRDPSLARTVAHLRRDHSAMTGYRLRLATALSYWQHGDPKSAAQAPLVADDYLKFCQRHVQTERDLLPTLRKMTSDKEWIAFNQAIVGVPDPLAVASSNAARFAALRHFD